MQPKSSEVEVQSTDPGVESLRKTAAHLGAPILQSPSPIPFGALVVGRMESMYDVVPSLGEGLKIVLFEILLEVASVLAKKQIDLPPWEF